MHTCTRLIVRLYIAYGTNVVQTDCSYCLQPNVMGKDIFSNKWLRKDRVKIIKRTVMFLRFLSSMHWRSCEWNCSMRHLQIFSSYERNICQTGWWCWGESPRTWIVLLARQLCNVASNIDNLWSPYGIGQTIYIFILWFVLSFFPRLISADADWMPVILPHMVWP